MRFGGKTYLSFDSMTASTAYVLGEFPWRVQVGDSVACQDFVAPPSMLSSEATGGEITPGEPVQLRRTPANCNSIRNKFKKSR